MRILIGDIVGNDIKEITDIATLFESQGKKETAQYLRGVATRYEMFFFLRAKLSRRQLTSFPRQLPMRLRWVAQGIFLSITTP